MNKLIYSLLFFFSFFFLSASLVHAYSSYNDNPFFTSDIKGYLAYNDINATYSYNALCGSFGGCMNIISSANTNFEIYMLNDNSDFVYSDNFPVSSLPIFTKTILSLPINTEGIVFLRYRFNQSLTTPIPTLYIYNQTKLYNYTLNNTANVWHNISVIIPASATAKDNIRAYVFYASDTPATLFEIEEFRYFTLDETYYWDNSLNKQTWCHYYINGIDGTCYQDFDVQVNSEPYAAFKTNLHNETPLNATCIFFNNTLIIRRNIERAGGSKSWFDGGSSDWVHSMFDITRDIIVLTEERYLSGASEWRGYNPMFVFGVNSNYITAFGINCTGDLCLHAYATGNDPAVFKFNVLGDVRFYNISQSSLQSITNVGISGFTPSGDKFKIYGGHSDWTSQNYSFFSYSAQAPRTYCQFGKVYFAYGFNTSLIYDCNLWGCNSEGTACNFGFIGTTCPDNYTLATYDISGSVSASTCYPQICVNLTSTTAGCFNTLDDAINSNTSSITGNAINNLATQPAKSIAMIFGSFFNITDQATANIMFSLMVSLIVALLITILLAKFGKLKGSTLASLFIIVMLVMLLMFQAAGFFSIIFTAILIIICGFILVKMLKIF